MDNSKKIILDLCGGTGAWSNPYKEAGYDVRLVTLPGHDVRMYKPPENVHGILAAPPCAEFSIAKGSMKRDFVSGLEIVEACLKIIWHSRIFCVLQWWCLENPLGFLRQFLGKPPQTIRYWWYGDGLDKPTDLWGYYELPKRRYYQPATLIKKIKNMPSGTQEERNKYRAITPPGFARSFFKANP